MAERKDVRIREAEGGWIVDLDYRYKERPKGEVAPDDLEFVTTSLEHALNRAGVFLAHEE